MSENTNTTPDGTYDFAAVAGFFVKHPEAAETYVLVLLEKGVGWRVYEVNGNPYSLGGASGTEHTVGGLVASKNDDSVAFTLMGRRYSFKEDRYTNEKPVLTCDGTSLEQLDPELFEAAFTEGGTKVLITVDENAVHARRS